MNHKSPTFWTLGVKELQNENAAQTKSITSVAQCLLFWDKEDLAEALTSCAIIMLCLSQIKFLTDRAMQQMNNPLSCLLQLFSPFNVCGQIASMLQKCKFFIELRCSFELCSVQAFPSGHQIILIREIHTDCICLLFLNTNCLCLENAMNSTQINLFDKSKI